MLKPLILLPILQLLTENLKSQRIYYSPPEGNFLFTYSHIVGQIKDHIIVWKYETGKPERSQIIIYDDRMNVLHHERTGILNFEYPFTIEFINLGESFSVV